MIEFLEKYELTPDGLFVLDLYSQYDFKDVAQYCKNLGLPRIKIAMNLVKLGYLHVDSYAAINSPELTDKGVKILNELNYREVYEKDQTSYDKDQIDRFFDEFWQEFPSWDNSLLSRFPKSRNLKSDKQGCRKLYEKILRSTNHEVIMRGLKGEIAFRKNTSATENKFKFMKNTKTWLNQREFENYLEYDTSAKETKGYSTGI